MSYPDDECEHCTDDDECREADCDCWCHENDDVDIDDSISTEGWLLEKYGTV